MLGLTQKIQLFELTPLWRLVQATSNKPWNWYYLSQNKFTYELDQIKLKLQIKAVNRIRKWYLKIYMHPNNYKHILFSQLTELGAINN